MIGVGACPFVMKFQKNILLKNHTSFKIGGPAKYFFEAENGKEIVKALVEAKRLKSPVFIFSGGSKLLVSDEGFNGLVIKIQNSKIKNQNDNSKSKIYCEAGAALSRLVSVSIKKGLTGLEWAVGIPGTVGGAVHGNAGAFGSSISKSVKSVSALNRKTLKTKKYSNKECFFGYRDSIFKKNKDIILSVELRLGKGNREKSSEILKECLKRRKERIPQYPSVGSIFKNLKFNSLNKKVKKIIPEDKIKGGMVPAGYLIEKCGLKGKKIGGAKISEQQANIIVNFKKAKAKDVSLLIDLARKQVKKKFGVGLEEEIIYLK